MFCKLRKSTSTSIAALGAKLPADMPPNMSTGETLEVTGTTVATRMHPRAAAVFDAVFTEQATTEVAKEQGSLRTRKHHQDWAPSPFCLVLRLHRRAHNALILAC